MDIEKITAHSKLDAVPQNPAPMAGNNSGPPHQRLPCPPIPVGLGRQCADVMSRIGKIMQTAS